MRGLVASVAACAAILGPAGFANAATLAGGADDAGGDVKVAGQDITAAAVVYDQAGIIRGAVTTAAPALERTTPAVSVMLGSVSRARGICEMDFVSLMFPSEELGPFGSLYVGRKDIGDHAISQQGQVIQFDSAAADGGDPVGPRPALAERPWTCGIVTTSAPAPGKKDFADADETVVFPLAAPTGAASPLCRVAAGRVRRGGRLRVRCIAVTGAVTVRLHRKKPRLARSAQLAPDGSAAIRIRKRTRRGGYIAAVWQGELLLGSRAIRVR